MPMSTGVGSPARSFTGGLPGATTSVPLRECRSVTTTVPPSSAQPHVAARDVGVAVADRDEAR